MKLGEENKKIKLIMGKNHGMLELKRDVFCYRKLNIISLYVSNVLNDFQPSWISDRLFVYSKKYETFFKIGCFSW